MKLAKKLQKQVADNEEREELEALPDGVYRTKLQKVELKEGAKGPYWAWTFEVDEEDGDYNKRLQWLNTSLSESSAWKLAEVFKAFGVGPDEDTDDLIGQHVRLAVSRRIIEQGARKGEMGNNVDKVLPEDEDDEDDDSDEPF